jgi:hypothetical protein
MMMGEGLMFDGSLGHTIMKDDTHERDSNQPPAVTSPTSSADDP